jgi:hypothetical protein
MGALGAGVSKEGEMVRFRIGREVKKCFRLTKASGNALSSCRVNPEIIVATATVCPTSTWSRTNAGKIPISLGMLRVSSSSSVTREASREALKSCISSGTRVIACA